MQTTMNQRLKPALGMILKGYPRISETFISNEILELERLGFKIHIFSMRRPRESFTHKSVAKICAKVDYLPETMLRHLPRLMLHNFRLAARIPRVYWRAVKVALRRFARTRKSATLKHLLQGGYLVDRLLPQSRVVHLHAHFAHSPTSVAMFASRLSGLDFSFTAHAKDIYTSHPGQLREKIALARFVVTCTGYNRKFLASLANGHITPLYRVYHGIDTTLFVNQVAGRVPQTPYRILTVARMTPKKGLPDVFAAIGALAKRGFAVEHTLIGDGEERDRILRLLNEMGLGAIIRCLGSLPHEEVLDHYRRSDCFVLGCHVAENGDRDGIPNVLMESMAMGVPVVATRVSAIPELVENEVTGLLVDPNDPLALALALERALTDQTLRNSVIPAARKRVQRHFSNKSLIADLAAIYRKEIPELES
jgi:glycosyltransferase involved in cell wall biosynthesis